MLTRHVKPQELSLDQIERVIEFLNRAQTAAEIAGRVEFAGERDVGLGVSRRLLTRRAELGGRFTTIQQVADVPQVGPERFTEIVLAITGYLPATADFAALEGELRTLRAELASLGSLVAPLRVELAPLVARHYLGQSVSLVARVVRGPDQAPVPGAAITLLATFGELESYDSFGLRRGVSLTLEADVDGVAYATWIPVTKEPCRPDQKAALEALLDDLPAEAPTPEKALDALDAIVTRYRRTESSALRGAIDIYFQSFADDKIEPLNAFDPFSTWPRIEASVLAFARAGDSSAVDATAVLDHPFRNWLFAFLARFSIRVQADNTLPASIEGLFEKGRNPGYILSAAYDRVRQYVEKESGVVGELLGRRVAEETLRQLTGTGLEKVPEEVRLAVRQGLGVVTNSVGSREGLRLVKGFDGTNQLLRTQTAALGSELEGKLGTFDGKLAQLDGKLDGFDSLLGELDIKLGTFDTKLGTFDSQLKAFDGELDGFGRRLNVELPALDTKIRDGNTALRNEVQASLGTLNGKVTAVETKLDTKVDQSSFSTFRQTLNADLTVMNQDIGQLKRR